MALIDELKVACDRLGAAGWRDLLLNVTGGSLDIVQTTAARLKTALTATIPTVNRSQPGFEDFHRSANQGVTPGSPARSLLYHALASSQVHPSADGRPAASLSVYPTLDELEALENFVYSLVSDRSDLAGTVVAVFAYQYREASRTTHLRHADMAYSRTGVARVGTTEPNYDRSRRSFWPIPSTGGDAIAVMPARYGVFLARRGRAGTDGTVQAGTAGEQFLFPVHKLFDGTECLKGRTLSLSFQEFHRNEKLRKTHLLPVSDGGLPLPAGFDLTKPPYVRDSKNGGNLVKLQTVGSSVLVVPKPAATLVRTATQKNSVSGKDQLVHFVVPNSERITISTLNIPQSQADRLAPEYVNIRHQVDPTGPVTQTLKDLNTLPPAAFAAAMKNGGFPAAHYIDDSCDGCIEAVVNGLASAPANLPAFSLVTAPDFLPLADQVEIASDSSIDNRAPLSAGRLPANPSLPRPSNPGDFAFQRAETTMTAVVGATAIGPPVPNRIGPPNRMSSFLPDAASSVFAPGWDVSRSRDALGKFLTSSGLGSPFPEDAKLCAAIGSFWPAVAPDNGRTFGNDPDSDISLFNQLPMLDEELGFHPNHERVKSGQIASYRGWDGEYGPFFEKVGTKTFVNFVPIERSDYVNHALADRIRVSLTAEVQSSDLVARHQAVNVCQNLLSISSGSSICLVVVRTVDDWAIFGRGRPELTGGGFLMEFAELVGGRSATSELDRVRRLVKKRHLCQFGVNGTAYKNGSVAFVFAPH